MENETEPLSRSPYLPGWVIIVTIGSLLYLITRRDSRVKKYVDQFDGPFSLPIIGSGFWFFRPNEDLLDLFDGWAKKYGPVYRLWMGNQASVVLSGTAEVEKILSSSVHLEKSTDYQFIHKWLGLSVLTASREKWHSRRKLLTPAFHFKILEEFLPIFNEQGNILIQILKKDQCNTQSFDICPYITRCTLDIICETAMGKKLYAQQQETDLKYSKVVDKYGDMILKRIMRPWLHASWIWKVLGHEKIENECLNTMHTFTEKVIAERRLERSNSSKDKIDGADDEMFFKKRKAFLDVLLDAAEMDKTLTDLNIREETDTFMFAGHETTASNIVWTMFTLSLYPEHQRIVQMELDEIFGEDKGREITSADVSQMKYLECCIKETLRLFPSIVFFIRHLKQDCDLGNGRIIPKGANVNVGTYMIHRNPKVFPEPEVFNPERFFPENCIGRSPFAFLPFSAGPRNCIGQKFALLEEKIVLAKLLLNFNTESVKKREEVKLLPNITLKPAGGLYIKLTERS